MTSTEVIAILGATTGIVGTALGLISFMRDRARVVVTWNSESFNTDEYNLVEILRIYIINAGRQPVPIVEVAIYSKHSLWQNVIRRLSLITHGIYAEAIKGWPQYALSISDEPVVLNPGEIKKIIMVQKFKELPAFKGYQAKEPTQYACATDYRGRRHWSEHPCSIDQDRFTAASFEPRQGDMPGSDG